MSATLQRRVEALEATSGDGGGCERCRGVLVLVSDAVTGEFYSASWGGEPLSEEDVHERLVETRCPKCGARIDPGEASVIKVGGLGS